MAADKSVAEMARAGASVSAAVPQVERSIADATRALFALQRDDGHLVFELEADATIPAEYVLLRHYLGEPVDAELERKIAVYLRRIQSGRRRLAAVPRRRLRTSAPASRPTSR